MTDFKKYSPFEPPANRQERMRWLKDQEDRIARRTRKALVQIIDDASDQYVNTLTAAGDMGVFDQIPVRWNAYVDNYLLDEVQGMYLSGGLTSWISTVGDRLPDDAASRWVEVVNQNAADYALVAKNRMADVGVTAWNTIKDRVSESIVKGNSIEEVKDMLMANRSFSEFRADTIARTETLNAYNNGNVEGAQALGEYGPTHKWWMATGDARGRPEHTAIDGVIVLMDEMFDVGGEPMLYPHDPNASAGNVVNCRCVVEFLYPGDPDPLTGELIPPPDGWSDPFSTDTPDLVAEQEIDGIQSLEQYGVERDLVATEDLRKLFDANAETPYLHLRRLPEVEAFEKRVAGVFQRSGMAEQKAIDAAESHVKDQWFMRKQLADARREVGSVVSAEKEMSLGKLLNEGKTVINLSEDSLLKVVDEGRFKSQFETGTSKGILNPQLRIKAERKILGLMDDLPASDRPIYGSIDDPRNRLGTNWAYGNTRVVLKEAVKDRSTFTAGDSLIGDLPSSTVRNPDLSVAFVKGEQGFVGYIETQILGGVSVNDVAEVFVSKVDDEAVYSRIKDFFRSKGVNVYRLNQERQWVVDTE